MKNKYIHMRQLLMFVMVLFFHGNAISKVILPKLISRGMVLQQGVKLNIWGWSAPGEKLTISFNSINSSITTVTANSEGKWNTVIPPQKAGGPFTMRISASNQIIVDDILVGDVWVCSGQSNMELMMSRVKYKYAEEIANAQNTNIRQFTIPDKYDFQKPCEDVEGGAWVSVNPKDILEFSAVAYFFAKEIFEKTGIPIGLINASLGGSPAEAWISEEGLKIFPGYYSEAQKYKNKELIREMEARGLRETANWYTLLNEKDEGLIKHWKSPAFRDSNWQEMNLPGFWADAGAGNFNGVVWYRKEISLPKSMINTSVKMELGRIVDADSVFINGNFVGNTSYQYPPRIYALGTSILNEGLNTIVVRVLNSSGKGGFVRDKPYQLTTAKDTILLSGNWKFKKGAEMPPLPEQTVIRWKPEGLFNGMIAPLLKYTIKGAIWYQGEANTSHPGNYKSLMQALIEDWRKKWEQGKFPFLFVQLANFGEETTLPARSNWAELREQQSQTLAVPNTAMVVTIDIGEWNDIHPLNKKEVGKRLFIAAQNIAYGNKEIVSSGPIVQSIKILDKMAVITFTSTGTGLIAKNGNELKQFSIAGDDEKFVWAKAKIDGNTVRVWNDEVAHPLAVRYAWADNPQGANLFNREGLPASPFRISTDTIVPVILAGTEKRRIRSAIVDGQEYELQIMLPSGYNKEINNYPVVYLMDAQWDFPLVKSIYGQNYYDGFFPKMILVGVTWGGINPNPDSLRARDYTPTNEKRLFQSGGADRFLSVMKNELFKYMETNYRVDTTSRTLMGCSLGGLFTLYTLFTHTDMFSGYVAASPAIGWDNEVLSRYAKLFSDAKPGKPVKLYLTVGDVERGRSLFENFAAELTTRNHSMVNVRYKVLENTGHSGTKSETYARGLQYIFERPKLNLDSAILYKYVGLYSLGNGNRVEIKKENGNLVIYFSPADSFHLFAASETAFYSTAEFFNIHFTMDGNNVSGFVLDRYGSIQMANKLITVK